MEHLTETLKGPQKWITAYTPCSGINKKNPMSMSIQEIKDEIVKLLYDSKYQESLRALDKELVTITIRQDKAHFFEFLEKHALTNWRTVGIWRKQVEPNLQIEIEFKDNKQECLGNRLIHLLFSYNKKEIKEDVLYARTTPIEEGTL